MTRTQHICLLANYNAWMNGKLLEAAMGLPDEEVAANRHAFFGSILGTLNHLLVGDTIWLQRFATHPARYAALDPIRQLPPPTSLDQTLCHDMRALAVHRRTLDECITAWTGTIQEPELDHVLLYANTKGVPANKNFYSLVMHFFNHQTHHRGQITTLLTQIGVDVGDTGLLALVPNDAPA